MTTDHIFIDTPIGVVDGQADPAGARWNHVMAELRRIGYDLTPGRKFTHYDLGRIVDGGNTPQERHFYRDRFTDGHQSPGTRVMISPEGFIEAVPC